MVVLTVCQHIPSLCCSELGSLSPAGYRCIATIDTVEFQNHGGLAFIHRGNVKFQKRVLDVNVTTFEYLYGYATTLCGKLVLFAIYRPGSQAISATFYDELSAVFERLATYNCPVVICGDLRPRRPD